MAKSKREREAEKQAQIEAEANTKRIAMELGRPLTKAGLARFYGISAREVARRIDDGRCVKCDMRPRGFSSRGQAGWDASQLCQECLYAEGVLAKLRAMNVDRGTRTTSIFHETPHARAMAKVEARAYRNPRPRKRTRVRGFIGAKYYASNPGPDGPTGVYRMIRDADGLTPQSWAGSGWIDNSYVWYKITSGGDAENITEEEARRLITSWGGEPVDMDFPTPETGSASTP